VRVSILAEIVENATQKLLGRLIPIRVVVRKQGEPCLLEADIMVHGCRPDRQQAAVSGNKEARLVLRHE